MPCGERGTCSGPDKAQYDFWIRDKRARTEAEKAWDADLVDEIKAVKQPEDITVFYAMLGNPLLGTMLPQHLAAWGVRTILIAGYHLDWCVEQAARTARDIGYNPIVIGDATAAGREADEFPTLERINTFFAPVIATDQAIGLLAEGADRRRSRGWP